MPVNRYIVYSLSEGGYDNFTRAAVNTNAETIPLSCVNC